MAPLRPGASAELAKGGQYLPACLATDADGNVSATYEGNCSLGLRGDALSLPNEACSGRDGLTNLPRAVLEGELGLGTGDGDGRPVRTQRVEGPPIVLHRGGSYSPIGGGDNGGE